MAAPYGSQETEFSTRNSNQNSDRLSDLKDSNYNSKSNIESLSEEKTIINRIIKVTIEEKEIKDTKNGSSCSPDKLKEMDGQSANSGPESSSKRAYVTVAILFFINLLNYMDRFTVAGVLSAVQDDFGINDAESGLLQTMFICAYMVFAPVFGYMGDRYSRKWIMIGGILIWSATVLASTFVPKTLFPVFLICRGIVGIGEASYSTVASTLIADLFTKDMRTRMLMLFYFAIPVGSGLGFMVGSSVAGLFPDKDVGWRWGVRVTPFFGVICLLLLIFVLKEPKRGESEHASRLQTSSWFADLKYLVLNRSFVWTTLGFTCVTFASGSLSWWGPNFVGLAEKSLMKTPDAATIGLIFGVITCVAGFAGVIIGSMWAQLWRKTNAQADPLVCGIGILVSIPFMYAALTVVHASMPACWAAVFLAVLCLSLNWALVSDILLYIVTPNRRSTASAIQILFAHLLGDATSPYLIGVVSDAIRNGSDSDAARFFALKYAMYIPCFVLVLGGFFFLGTAWYVEADRKASHLLSMGIDPNSIAPTDTLGSPQFNRPDGYGGLSVVGDLPSPDSQARLIPPDEESTNDGDADIRYRL